MFRLLEQTPPELVDIDVDGNAARVPAGITAAAALLYLDCLPTRLTPVRGAPRAPYCMIGACYECLLEIDGRANQRGCQVEVRAGMSIRRQLQPPPAQSR